MKMMKRVTLWVLILATVLSAVSCSETNSETAGLTETRELSATEQAALDEAYLDEFAKDYFGGKYKEDQLFLYDDFSQYLQLGEYKGITYPDDNMLVETVSDQEVSDYLQGIQLVGLMKDEDFEEITEGVVQQFDTVLMDYKGYIDGEATDATTAEDQELLIGSNQFIDGFEEGLIGQPIGQEVVLNLKFSPYYSGGDVAGKEAQFHVTVKSLKRAKSIPELTVEAINELYQSDFENMDAVREDIRGYLESEKENTAYSSLANYLQLKLMDSSTVIKYPDREVNYYRKHFEDYYTQDMEEGQSIDEYCEEVLGVSYEEFDADALAYAQETVKGTLMLRLVAQMENIQCNEDQLKAMIYGLYQMEGYYYGDLKSFVADYIDIYGPDYFENRVITAAAVESIVEYAVKES